MNKFYSVLTDDLAHCVITGSPTVAIHHVFGAANRSLSEKYGFVIPLRPDWHNMADYEIHFNRDLDLYWKRRAQEYYEAHYGTRAELMRELGRNYL